MFLQKNHFQSLKKFVPSGNTTWPVAYEITSDCAIKYSKYPKLTGEIKGVTILNKKEEWLTKMIDGWRKNFEHTKMITQQNDGGLFNLTFNTPKWLVILLCDDCTVLSRENGNSSKWEFCSKNKLQFIFENGNLWKCTVSPLKSRGKRILRGASKMGIRAMHRIFSPNS